jgi:hypothetical protein
LAGHYLLMFRTPHISFLVRTAAMLKASTSPRRVPAIAICEFALPVTTRRAVVTTGVLVVGHNEDESAVSFLPQSGEQTGMG